MNKKEYQWQFDVLKCVSCIIVVLFHYPIKNVVGDIIIYAFRFPVPIFCIITGYFTCSRDYKWLWKKALYILRLLIIAEVLHGIKYYFMLSKGLAERREIVASFPDLIQKVFCGSFFNGTLWFLYGAFWTYLLIILIKKKGIQEKYYWWMIITLLLANVFGRYYIQCHFDIEKYVWLFRNALSMNLPLTLLGMIIYNKRDYIKSNINVKKALSIIFFGNCLIVAEYFISGMFMDFHISTFFISAGLFIFAMIYEGRPNRILKVMSFIGRKWSMPVYIIHPFWGSAKVIAKYYFM